jgi:hypothetical protein
MLLHIEQRKKTQENARKRSAPQHSTTPRNTSQWSTIPRNTLQCFTALRTRITIKHQPLPYLLLYTGHSSSFCDSSFYSLRFYSSCWKDTNRTVVINIGCCSGDAQEAQQRTTRFTCAAKKTNRAERCANPKMERHFRNLCGRCENSKKFDHMRGEGSRKSDFQDQ